MPRDIAVKKYMDMEDEDEDENESQGEAKIHLQMSGHKNIVRCYGVVKIGMIIHIMLELCDGNLQSHLEDNR